MNDIVVGIDRSETAAHAATVGAEMASALGVNLHLVTCADKASSTNLTVGSDRFHADWLNDAELFVNDTARKLAHDQVTCTVGTGIPATFPVRRGPPPRCPHDRGRQSQGARGVACARFGGP